MQKPSFKNRLLKLSVMAAVAGVTVTGVQAAEIEEIVVTAQKREQNLQDVGITVTALDSEALERAGIEDISRIELVTPGVSYGFVGSDAKIAIRGANSNNTFADNSSIAGFFVDGVYRPRASQQSQAFFDIGRVEILKGPQGTLYGRNTFAGALNLYTNNPDTEATSGGIELSAASFGRITTEGFYNMPVSDELAFRFAFNTKDSDGYIENRGSGEDFGQEDAKNYRLSALWAPTDSFEMIARYTSISEKGTTAGIFSAEGICQPVNASGVTDAYGTLVNCDNPYGGASDPTNAFFDTPWVAVADATPFRDNKEDNLTVDMSYDLTEDVTMRSITSYTDFNSGFDWDGDWSDQTGYTYFWDEQVESFTQELQLVSSGDSRLGWTTGAYYSVDEIGFGFSQYRTGPAFSFSDFADYQEIETTTLGLFFQGEYDLTDQTRLIAGARGSLEKKDTATFSGSSNDVNGTPLPGVTPTGLDARANELYRYTLRPERSANREFSKFTWKLGVEHDYNDDVLVYANASTGFLSGGVNSDGSPFEQQDSLAYEAGVKTRLRDNTLQLNAAIYRNEFSNLTTQELIVLNGADITRTVNGGEVDATGLEIEAIWLPTDNWRLSSAVSFMNSEFGKFGAANPFVEASGVVLDPNFLDLEGLTPPWSPDVTLSFSAGYDYQLANGSMLTPMIQLYYSDSYNTDDVVTYSTQVQDSYTKTDLRLQWESASGMIGAEAFIENLEDEAVLARTNVGGFDLVQSSFLYPRNAGVKFSYKF